MDLENCLLIRWNFCFWNQSSKLCVHLYLSHIHFYLLFKELRAFFCFYFIFKKVLWDRWAWETVNAPRLSSEVNGWVRIWTQVSPVVLPQYHYLSSGYLRLANCQVSLTCKWSVRKILKDLEKFSVGDITCLKKATLDTCKINIFVGLHLLGTYLQGCIRIWPMPNSIKKKKSCYSLDAFLYICGKTSLS